MENNHFVPNNRKQEHNVKYSMFFFLVSGNRPRNWRRMWIVFLMQMFFHMFSVRNVFCSVPTSSTPILTSDNHVTSYVFRRHFPRNPFQSINIDGTVPSERSLFYPVLKHVIRILVLKITFFFSSDFISNRRKIKVAHLNTE